MSSNSYFAIIEREEVENNKGTWPKFCGSNLKIFNPILTHSLEISEDLDMTYKESDKQLINWNVTFFKDSPFAQTLNLKVIEQKLLTNDHSDIQSSQVHNEQTVAKIVLVDRVNESVIDNICKSASKFVCGNKALTEQDLNNLPSQWRYIDGKGMILFNKYKSGGLNYPKKQILLLMLAVAYSQAFEDISEKLAAALKPIDIEETPSKSNSKRAKRTSYIEELYEQASQFNARYYFFNPVRITNYPTYQCWQDIRQAYQLQTQYHELNEQIGQVHSILSYRQKKRDDMDSERWNKKVTTIGLFLSGLGLIEVVETAIEVVGLLGGIFVGLVLSIIPFLIYNKIKPKDLLVK